MSDRQKYSTHEDAMSHVGRTIDSLQDLPGVVGVGLDEFDPATSSGEIGWVNLTLKLSIRPEEDEE